VVNWDQRGSGRTYGRNGPTTPGMSTPDAALDRLRLDAREVAEYARNDSPRRRSSWSVKAGARNWDYRSSSAGPSCSTPLSEPVSRSIGASR
jgi:hypothetical protein